MSNSYDIKSLLRLESISKIYGEMEGAYTALKNITINIHVGEMIALVGPSGSGKSTLLNILGLLDTPSEGSYEIDNTDTTSLSSDDLAWLRRRYFGFIFQRYQLITNQTVLQNVTLPAIYAGDTRANRNKRAEQLLTQLGISDKFDSYPFQLSGGQQQRVSIARALINGCEVILADEPTGALDKRTGTEVIEILRELQSQGHTVIIVTHDNDIANCADRIIQLCDGEIVSDSYINTEKLLGVDSPKIRNSNYNSISLLSNLQNAIKMAFLAIKGFPLRASLTILGIVIGITAMSCMVGLGQGAREKVLSDIKNIGYNTYSIYPGKGWGDKNANTIKTLKSEDASLLSHVSGITQTSPQIFSYAKLQVGNKQVETQLIGVNDLFFSLAGKSANPGRLFSYYDIKSNNPVIVIDKNTKNELFALNENAIGSTVKVNNFIATVVGVTSNDGFMKNSASYLPYTVLQLHQPFRENVDSIVYKIRDGADSLRIREEVTNFLTLSHGKEDFFIHSPDELINIVESSASTLTLLILSISFISLIIGGIGVMNMMLVSVTERTHEIGIRLALGARGIDIMMQFLIESVLLCLTGGIIGAIVSAFISIISPHLFNEIPLIFSPLSVFVAVFFSSITGIIFGYAPARNAARLNPVSALSQE